uniref:Uncharacterized protein n=1 Tax=Cucumis melo TaxID=3656 RepID=A0A9I9D8X5_CUCME
MRTGSSAWHDGQPSMRTRRRTRPPDGRPGTHGQGARAPHAIGARDAPRARPCPPKAEKSPEASRTFYDGRDDSGRLQKTRERPRRGWNAREQPGWPMSVRAQPRSLQTRPEASMSVQRHTMTVRSVMVGPECSRVKCKGPNRLGSSR